MFIFISMIQSYLKSLASYHGQRWGQPAQQQGRRIPSASFARVLWIRRLLVSGFLADSIQQIHSLRASGVISSHAVRAAGVAMRVLRKSAGILCTILLVISFGMNLIIRYEMESTKEFRISIKNKSISREAFPSLGGYPNFFR
jgi:preprotein translocase subunit SecG